jgi:hypothetical protein
LGIAFQYPDNWVLDEDEARAGRHSVTVYSPAGGFWSIAVYPRGTDPAKLARAALKAMQEEYEDSENEEVQETIAGRELTGYDLNFFYLDLTNTACIRCLRTQRATYTVFWQAEDREFEQYRLVFQAMITSFLRSL